MIQIKRWWLLVLLMLAFTTGLVFNSATSKIGWNCTIDATRSIEICTRGVLM